MSRWNISDDQRREVVSAMAAIATDIKLKPRDRVSAARALMEADRVNLSAERDPPRLPIASPKAEEPVGNRFLVVARQLNLTIESSGTAITTPEDDIRRDERPTN